VSTTGSARLISSGGGGNGIGFVSATGGGGGGGGVSFKTFRTGGGGLCGSSRGTGGGVGSMSSTGSTTGFVRAKSGAVHWLDSTPAMPKWISPDKPSAMLHEESESRTSTHTNLRASTVLGNE
jgi:hypothetical protein